MRLVPSLIIDTPTDPHVGTTDLDVGLALAVFDNQRYQELAQRLRQADFGMEVSRTREVAPILA